MTGGPGAQLIWIPIIHAQVDFGSMSDAVRQLYLREVGQAKWDRHVQMVTALWKGIRQQVERLDLDYSKVRLYQDGLPVCGREREMIQDLASSGSPNYEILLDLVEKGAQVVGTESPELLRQEYELAQQVLLRAPPQPTARLEPRQQQLGRALLNQRDRFIAERIRQTLSPGETGLLFLGMLHSLDGLLPSEIKVVRLGQALPATTRRASESNPGRGGQKLD